MYSEEQTNQNPGNAEIKKAQEENSETVEKAVEKKENNQPAKASASKQISPKEKKEIANLLKDVKPDSKKKETKNEVSEIVAEEPKKVEDKPSDTPPKNATAEPLKPKHQISDKGRQEIVDMLADKSSVLPVGKIVDKGPDKLPGENITTEPVDSKQQISDIDRQEIIDMLADKSAGLPSKKAADQKPEKRVKQISGRERKAIIGLLRDRPSAGDVHEELVADDIDYNHLNKQELVELFEEIVQEKDISRIKKQVGEINAAFHQCNREEKEKELNDFIAGGGKKEDYKHTEDPLEQRFKAAFNVYKHNKAKYAEELEHRKHDNLALKVKILDELRALIDSEETLKNTYDEFRRLQDRWKEIGMVPASELNNLWQNYHFLVERFFDKVRINKELRDLDLKKNLEQKIILCEKAEELLVERSIIRSFKLLQKYHDKWREIGPVPIEKKDEIWERFKLATDKINVRRKEHYKIVHEDQQKNFDAKVVLCEEAEVLGSQAVSGLKEWQKKTDEINELFKTWKTIGRAPKSQNDEIWNRFKTAMDTFFGSKREFLGKLKDQQMDNLNIKIDLCVQAEAIKDSEEWRNTTNELIRLQKDWKKIGPVPRRHSEKVWKRFRSACDTFFNRKSDFFKNIHVVEAENFTKKEELVKKILAYKISKDKSANLEMLKSFQRSWMDTGHVPFKDKDKLQKKYREAIDQLIDKMDIDRQELSQTDYKNKIDMLKGDKDSEWRLEKERTNLMGKMKKLNDEIALWENNIGFFASSKSSDLLRKEFESKIEKAKKEVDSFKSRLKILNG